MVPYAGFLRISSARSSLLKSSGRTMPFLVPFQSSFFLAFSFSATFSASHWPIAGALESPGDSIPAASKKPGASEISPITKSSPSSWARSPAKEVITWRNGMPFTLSDARLIRESSSSATVAVCSLFSISVAVGPVSRFPCTVGLTKTPLPILVGSWKMVWLTRLPASLSSRQ